jgi:hypothetical protein
MNIQERIQNRHQLLKHLAEKQYGVERAEIEALGDWTRQALDDLLYLGLVAKNGEKIVVPEKVKKRIEQLGWLK